MVSKHDFVLGAVPHHNHGSLDYTSVEAGHVHQCLDVTYPPTLVEGGGQNVDIRAILKGALMDSFSSL